MQFFQFTREQEMLRKAVREFAEAEIAPKAAEWDEKDYCPIELFPKMGEMGITGVFVPEEYGGAGLGHVEMLRGDIKIFSGTWNCFNDSSFRIVFNFIFRN